MAAHETAHRTACQDCGHALAGPYCSNCGQHDVDYHRSILHVLEDSVEGLFHFDGKFFRSLRYLLTRPGFLTAEFLDGRRTRYSNPVRFYVFASFLFFLAMGTRSAPLAKLSASDADPQAVAPLRLDRPAPTPAPAKPGAARPAAVPAPGREPADHPNLATVKLPSWFDGWIERHLGAGQEAYGKDYGRVMDREFRHLLPTVVFLCLPLFALLLKLAYRRNARRLYIEQLIFCLHGVTLVYIVALAAMLVDLVLRQLGFGVKDGVDTLAFFLGVYLMFRSLRVVYGEGRLRTAVKMLAVGLGIGIVVVAGLMVAAALSFAIVTGEA
jgi:hypothetical protein